MKTQFFFAAKSIGLSKREGRKPCSLLSAARHNLREIQAELGADGRMDAKRSQLNEILMGESIAEDVNANALKTLSAWGFKKPRKDYVQAIEMVFSLPANSELDQAVYFGDCLEWVCLHMGRENILSAVIHRDETAPHCHVLVLPFKNEHYVGGKPIMNGPLSLLRKSFAQDVALKHGLQITPEKRLSRLELNTKSEAVLNHLQRTHDPAVSSKIWPVVRKHIQGNPEPYMGSLGLSYCPVPVKKKMRSSTQIMTSTGRKTSQDREPRDGFGQRSFLGQTLDQNLSCVGIAQKITGIHTENLAFVTGNTVDSNQQVFGAVQ